MPNHLPKLARMLVVSVLVLGALPALAADSSAFTTDLSSGMNGPSIVSLQKYLIGQGFSIPAGTTGKFGAQTRAAVIAWQKAAGITPASGFFGPKSRAKANGGSTTTAPALLTGSGGYLTSFSQLGDVEQLFSDGSDDTKVLGISMTARGSDLSLERLDAQFDLSGSSGSLDLSHYVKSASVYLNGAKLGTVQATDGTYQNKVWTLRFSNLHGVIKVGTTANLYIEVTPVDMVRGDDFTQDVKVSIPANGLRTVDGQRISSTYPTAPYSATFDINDGTLGTLTLTEAADDPKATVVKTDTNNTTSNVTLLSFNAGTKYENTTVKTLPIELTETGTTNVSDIIQTLSLMKGGTVVATKTVSTAGSSVEVDFTNLAEAIDQDASATYTVVASVKKSGSGSSGSAFDAGDTLQASVLSTDPWDATDDTGYETEMQGSVVAGTLTFQPTGIMVTQVSATSNKSVGTTAGSGDSTQYAITFKMTAGDADLYIPTTVTRSTASSGTAITWATTTSSSQGTASASTTNGTANITATDSNSADTGSVFKIPAGTSRTFTLNVTVSETAGTLFTGVRLTGIAYSTTTSFSNYVYASALDQFKTQDVSMRMH